MKYMGSKNRIAKHILPIMLEAANEKQVVHWVEPFVGGGNMIDKVPPSFDRIGTDINPHAIQALRDIRDRAESLPLTITEEQYKAMLGQPAGPTTSLVRFGASFGGKFEAGFARGKSNGGTARDYWAETRRNALKQAPLLQGVGLLSMPYGRLSEMTGALIYCDPPYQGTTEYKTGAFDHAAFWQWCRDMAERNLVFVSEYNAPEDFECVWAGEIKTNFSSTRKSATHNATERLFTYRGSFSLL